MWWSQEGRELDDIPVMTDEVPLTCEVPLMTGEDLLMTGEVPLMTGEVSFTGEVQWWGFGLTWKQ